MTTTFAADKWCQIFRAGKHKGYDYTTDHLDRMVANFDPATRRVPIVVGHPKNEDPAFGWVSKLRRSDDVLEAQFSQVEPTFAQWVDEGRYDGRSIKVRGLKSGDPSLVHVGWLGAVPPFVEGLAPFQFSHDDPAEDSDDVAVFTFDKQQGDPKMTEINGPKFTQDDIDKAVAKAIAAVRAEDEAKFSALTVELDQERTARLVGDMRANVAKLVNDGKVPPAMADGLAEFMASLDDTDEVEFSTVDTDGKESTTTSTRRKWFEGWLGRFKDCAIFSSAVVDKDDPGLQADVDQFDSAGMSVSDESLEWRKRAASYAEKHGCDLDTALLRTR
jgi:hypothetical protein